MIRKAMMSDVKEIHKLIDYCAKKGDMLPRSLVEIYENLRDFFVFVENNKINAPIGVCALHFCWDELGEIRSLAVKEEYTRKGIGSKLVKKCINEAKKFGIEKLFSLTYKPDFFKRFGFNEVDKSTLPHKIWQDCLKCSEFPDCTEVAMMLELSR